MIIWDTSGRLNNMMHKVTKCCVDKLPDSCIECLFLRVNNNAWDPETKQYTSIQYCPFGEDGIRLLPERWRTRRDPECILELLKENNTENIKHEIPEYYKEDNTEVYVKEWKR